MRKQKDVFVCCSIVFLMSRSGPTLKRRPLLHHPCHCQRTQLRPSLLTSPHPSCPNRVQQTHTNYLTLLVLIFHDLEDSKSQPIQTNQASLRAPACTPRARITCPSTLSHLSRCPSNTTFPQSYPSRSSFRAKPLLHMQN
jgi:hypothetical protein